MKSISQRFKNIKGTKKLSPLLTQEKEGILLMAVAEKKQMTPSFFLAGVQFGDDSQPRKIAKYHYLMTLTRCQHSGRANAS